jgi:hypothetical protein
MPKILWIGTATEIEPDIVHDAKLHAVDLEVWNVDTKLTEPQRYDVATRTRDVPGGQRLVDLVARASFDLAVFRFPHYFDERTTGKFDLAPLRNRPVCTWASEQGPMLEVAMRAAAGFRHVVVNNRHEMGEWRARFAQSASTRYSVHYVPVGCTERYVTETELDKVSPIEARDLLADGKAHYECTRCSGDWKRRSVEALVSPMIEGRASLSLYGPDEGLHGWYAVPGAGDYYRGQYAPETYVDVYARHKIYLGITWNWGLGGYGIKLARALAAGIPVLWHRTVGMAEDDLVAGKHLALSSSADETRMRVEELLADDARRAELGAEGQRFALENWRWAPNLLRLLEEVNCDR